MTDSVKEQDSSSIPSLTESDEEGEGVALYKYRDFSTVNIQELEAQARSSPESPTPHGANASDSSIRAQRFPVKLFKILAQKEFNEIITWMPHGRSVSPSTAIRMFSCFPLISNLTPFDSGRSLNRISLKAWSCLCTLSTPTTIPSIGL